MNSMEPIRTDEGVNELQERLWRIHPKYAIMFLIGLDTGLRIGDILRLKGSNFDFGNEVVVREQKTSKERLVAIKDETGVLLNKYKKMFRILPDEYLIYSREGKRDKSLSRSRAYQVMSAAGVAAGMAAIGTHTMRKTYALKKYQEHGSIAELNKDLKHSQVSTTAGYLLPSAELDRLLKMVLPLPNK